MSTRKGQAASVTLLRREQLRSASASTRGAGEDRRSGRTGASAPTFKIDGAGQRGGDGRKKWLSRAEEGHPWDALGRKVEKVSANFWVYFHFIFTNKCFII